MSEAKKLSAAWQSHIDADRVLQAAKLEHPSAALALVIPDLLKRSLHVVGEVELRGRVIEHRFGYRAEHARPHELFDFTVEESRGVLYAAADRYAVAVVRRRRR